MNVKIGTHNYPFPLLQWNIVCFNIVVGRQFGWDIIAQYHLGMFQLHWIYLTLSTLLPVLEYSFVGVDYNFSCCFLRRLSPTSMITCTSSPKCKFYPAGRVFREILNGDSWLLYLLYVYGHFGSAVLVVYCNDIRYCLTVLQKICGMSLFSEV